MNTPKDITKFLIGSDPIFVDGDGVTQVSRADKIPKEEKIVDANKLAMQAQLLVPEEEAAPPSPEKRRYKTPQHHITRSQMISALRRGEASSTSASADQPMQSSEAMPTTPQPDVEDEIEAIWKNEEHKPTINKKPSGKYKKAGQRNDNKGNL